MSAGPVRDPEPVDRALIAAVCAGASRAHTSLARWWSYGDLRSRTRSLGDGDFRNGFMASLNGGLIESRAIAKRVTPHSYATESYRLTDAGWALTGGKPLWL